MISEFISVSKACKNKKLSVKKVLEYLSTQKIIPKPSQRKNKSFFNISDELQIMSTGTSIRVIESEFNDYIDEKDIIDALSYTDETKEILDMVEDPKIRFSRINAIRNQRLMFIDAEFKEGNYHEIAYEITENGQVVESRYMLVRENYIKSIKRHKENNRVNRLKHYGRDFEIVPRKHINRTLKRLLRTVKYVVAHNAHSERSILSKNGMSYEKQKFLCTSKMSEGFIFDRSPSLMELNDYYRLKYDSHFTHYAVEDTAIARKLFFRMVDDAVEKFEL